MRSIRETLTTLRRPFRLHRLQRLRKEEDGATAIEFAIVITPFLMFIFGLVGCALYFFIMSSVEKGMDQSSRLIRTGQAVTSKMTVDDFKQSICNGAGPWIRCPKLQIFVNRFPDWASVAPQQCVDGNKVVITNSAPGTDLIATYSGTFSDIVMVTACYRWDFPANLPFLKLGNMNDGSMMLQTTTAFRSEPYPQT